MDVLVIDVGGSHVKLLAGGISEPALVDGGRMLFFGLGTGLGSALVTEHVVVPLELAAAARHRTLEA